MRPKHFTKIVIPAITVLALTTACASSSTPSGAAGPSASTNSSSAGVSPSSGPSSAAVPASSEPLSSEPPSNATSLSSSPSPDSSTTPSDLDLIKAGTLTACATTDYKPFEMLDSSGKHTGYDIDVERAIAEGLNLNYEPVQDSFTALSSGAEFNSRHCDVGVLTITDERAKKMSFSDPFYKSKLALMVPKGSSVTSLADLAGKKLGIKQGDTSVAYAEKHDPKTAEIVKYPSQGATFQAIAAGNVDAVLADLPIIVTYIKGKPFKIADQFQGKDQFGLATRLGNTALIEAINAQLADLKSSGELKKIYDRYFSTN